jgi:hypothetical protein
LELHGFLGVTKPFFRQEVFPDYTNPNTS